LYPSLIPNHRVYLCRTHAREFFGSLCRHSTVLSYWLQDWHACTLHRPIYKLSLLISFSLQIRAAIVSAVYRKAFRLSSGSRQASTLGEIVNLYAFNEKKGISHRLTNRNKNNQDGFGCAAFDGLDALSSHDLEFLPPDYCQLGVFMAGE